MRSDDIEQVAAIEVEVTPSPWSNRQFQQSLEQHQSCGYLPAQRGR